MSQRDNDLRVRPGRIRDSGRSSSRPKSFVGQVMRAAKKAGHVGDGFGRGKGGASRSHFGRGRRAALSLSLRSTSRRVVMKARVVRHHGTRFRSAPLPKHITYLKREGVTRDGADARMFDATSDAADERAFAERCKDDRHHFRFIISPEDAAELGDLRTFTRELMTDVARDLGTKLDWIAVQINVRVRLALAARVSAGHQVRRGRGFRLGVTPAEYELSNGLPERSTERRAGDVRIPEEMGRLLSLMTRRGPFMNRRSSGRPRPCPRWCRVVRSVSASRAAGATLPRAELASGSIRAGTRTAGTPCMRIQGAQHHLWLKEAPQLGVSMQPNCRSMRILRSARMPHIGCGAPSTVVRQDLPSISFRHSGASGWPWRCERSTVT